MLVTSARLRPVSLSTPALPAAAKQMAYSVQSVSAGQETSTQSNKVKPSIHTSSRLLLPQPLGPTMPARWGVGTLKVLPAATADGL